MLTIQFSSFLLPNFNYLCSSGVILKVSAGHKAYFYDSKCLKIIKMGIRTLLQADILQHMQKNFNKHICIISTPKLRQ